MESKIIPSGDDYAIVIERALLEQLGLEVGSPIYLTTDGRSILVTPKDRETRVSKIVEEMDQQYGSVFKRLAE